MLRSKNQISRRVVLALPLIGMLPEGAWGADTRGFLRMRHAWCPYALPAETTLGEIEMVAKRGFDAVGVSFVGPYNGGKIDFSTLDAAITLVAKYRARAVLHIAPRFSEADQVGDTLHDGTVLPHVWNKSPNYSIADIFASRQQALFTDYLRQVGERYGRDSRVAGYALGWGYMGETGFFIGDFLSDFKLIGATSAGYSGGCLEEFNTWRTRRTLPKISKLPVPIPTAPHQSEEYLLFQRFRSDWVRDVFQKALVAAVKSHASQPVGIFGYRSASPNNYARNWQSTPNADFYRSAASAATFDMPRTLLDSGVGWEDCDLHQGKWDFTAACMRRDEARQIARGAVFHAMHVRVYTTEPQWEPGIFDKVCDFLKTETLARQAHRETPIVGLYQPTWGAGVLASHSTTQPFLPNQAHANNINKMIGLVESFGLPYRMLTEEELIAPNPAPDLKHLIVPLWDLLETVVGKATYASLSADPRLLPLPLLDRPYTRSEFRTKLQTAHIVPRLEVEEEKILAGRTANLVYNWNNMPITVRVPEQKTPIELGAHEYRFLK